MFTFSSTSVRGATFRATSAIFNEGHLRSDDPHSQAAFQRWLEERFGTIRELNLV